MTTGRIMALCVVALIALLISGKKAEVWAATGIEVNGDLQLSGAGGVVFPDGTIQTTASRPTWSQKIPGAARWMLVLDNVAVLDRETGLVWQRQTDGVTKQHYNSTTSRSPASDYCTTLTLGGRMGWRLPTIGELATLVDITNFDPALPSGHFFTDAQNILSAYYWASTIDANIPSNAWYVYFNSGFVYNDWKMFSFYVRCVRSG